MGLLLSLLKAPVNAEIITPAATEVTDPGNSLHPEAVGGRSVVAAVVVVICQGVEAGHALNLERTTGASVIRVSVSRGHLATPWHERGGAIEETPRGCRNYGSIDGSTAHRYVVWRSSYAVSRCPISDRPIALTGIRS